MKLQFHFSDIIDSHYYSHQIDPNKGINNAFKRIIKDKFCLNLLFNPNIS